MKTRNVSSDPDTPVPTHGGRQRATAITHTCTHGKVEPGGAIDVGSELANTATRALELGGSVRGTRRDGSEGCSAR